MDLFKLFCRGGVYDLTALAKTFACCVFTSYRLPLNLKNGYMKRFFKCPYPQGFREVLVQQCRDSVKWKCSIVNIRRSRWILIIIYLSENVTCRSARINQGNCMQVLELDWNILTWFYIMISEKVAISPLYASPQPGNATTYPVIHIYIQPKVISWFMYCSWMVE